MIPRNLQSLFSTALRSRGDEYATSRRVRITRSTREVLIATVRGSDLYDVEITAAEGEVLLVCTCPYGVENGVCKHLWAVLRVSDKEAKLAPLLELAGPDAEFCALPGDAAFENDVDEDPEDLWDEDAEENDDHRAGAEAFREAVAPTVPRALSHRPPGPRAPKPRAAAPPKQPEPKQPEWKAMLDAARRPRPNWPPAPPRTGQPSEVWPADRRIAYVVDFVGSGDPTGIFIDLRAEKRQRDGSWDPTKALRGSAATWLATPDPVDRQIIQMLIGSIDLWRYGGYSGHTQQMRTRFYLSGAAFDTVFRLMGSTGRCSIRVAPDKPELSVSVWDEGPPWRFALRVSPASAGSHTLSGTLVRGDDRMTFAWPTVAHASGLVFSNGTLARGDFEDAFALALSMYQRGAVPLAAKELPALLDTVLALPEGPALDLPPECGVSQSNAAPIPCLSVTTQVPRYGNPIHALSLTFSYGTTRVLAATAGNIAFDRDTLTVHRRDARAEAAAHSRLLALGAREQWDYSTRGKALVIKGATKFTAMVTELATDGWLVNAGPTAFRTLTGSRAELRSGIDWFDLDAAVQFGDNEVSLHALIEAERRGDIGVSLPDGTLGLLPTDWLARWRPAAAGGVSTATAIRFTRAQTALLDALLAALPEVNVDATFETARTELRRFDRVAPADAPATFVGTLRDYQREGLGWLHFLRRFRLGGCLADDMGLGKTVQVLALLEARRVDREANGPSLVVVPRSLVRNWMLEAERFAPALRIVDHSMPGRKLATLDLSEIDLLITTYGVLRREAPRLAEIEFDYAILDEAQAIKNATTASAKAARLIRARHRLAVTGTPIENRLEELWSIFEFLNPGMLGGATGFGRLVKAARASNAGAEADADNTATTMAVSSAGALMSRALRPVILRRTKQLVAKELPERSEQTLEVELEPPQRKFYDALLARYRLSVLDRVDRLGISRSRMHILEALLRLRQAACHPVLADARKSALPSAKLDALIPALSQLAAEGHKALVFSQFTSFLALVRTGLDSAGIPYEYLDGATRDRQKRVDHFQNDPACPVFLISLKAGGQGLNLTSADYVYLLDPWWNPAVEAQAIDRSHRIGQKRRVIATRLVARGTIEEKILLLHASKRALADAILSEDQGLLTGIGRDELVALLA